MLKKLNLDQTKLYEKHIALEEISFMLLAFVQGRPHHLEIGAEQGDVFQWDDLVIKSTQSHQIHVQIKRQTTDFSKDAIEHDCYTKEKRKGKLRDLSPLDIAIRDLGILAKSSGLSNNIQREFWLIIPEGAIEIKKGILVRHLRKLCDEQIVSVTKHEDLESLAKIDSTVDNIYKWLTTWCDYTDWEHILNAFKHLRIKVLGLESEICKRVDDNLRQIFKSTDIETVRLLILSYLDDNSSYAGSIKPRQLLNLLKEYLLPNISRWTLFKLDGHTWHISGMYDLLCNDEIERPCVIVPAMWAKENSFHRVLKIDGIYADRCQISENLIRLSLHPYGSFDIYCSDKSSWDRNTRTKVGGTLGVNDNDLLNLRIIDGLDTFEFIESRDLESISEIEQHATELSNEMNRVTFDEVDEKIFAKIRDMKSGLLRSEVEARWKLWKLELKSDSANQKQLFSRMLHPIAEGKSISGELRVGPKTSHLICESLFLMLVISVCVCEGDYTNWDCISSNMKMQAIGLAYWSGPAEGNKKIIKVDNDDGLIKLLECESGQIIIIPQSTLNETDILQETLADDYTKHELLMDSTNPKILVTKDRKFEKLLEKADVEELAAYFSKSISIYQENIASAVNRVVGEVHV